MPKLLKKKNSKFSLTVTQLLCKTEYDLLDCTSEYLENLTDQISKVTLVHLPPFPSPRSCPLSGSFFVMDLSSSLKTLTLNFTSKIFPQGQKETISQFPVMFHPLGVKSCQTFFYILFNKRHFIHCKIKGSFKSKCSCSELKGPPPFGI